MEKHLRPERHIPPVLNRYPALAAALFTTGIILLVSSVMRGEGAVGIALIVPFFYGTGPLASLGVLCIFIGVLVIFYAALRGAISDAMDEGEREGAARQAGSANDVPGRGSAAAPVQASAGRRSSGGAVILIGPIPIILGSDRTAARNLILLALVLMLVAFGFMAFLAMG